MSEFLKGSDPLTRAIAELKANPFSPEAFTNYWQVKLKASGLDIFIPDCNWTEDEIQKPMIDVYGKEVQGTMYYLPEELVGKKGTILLGKMFPKIQKSYSISIIDTHNTIGWIKGYAALHGVNLNTTQKDLEDFAKQKGYLYGRLRSYILVSQLMNDFTGHYVDEKGTLSRLLGSRHNGNVVRGYFYPNGDLLVHSNHYQQNHNSKLGGWLDEAKPQLASPKILS